MPGMRATVVLCMVFSFADAYGMKVEKYPLLMPNVWPTKEHTYLCTSIRIDPGSTYYVVAFEPNATMNTVHHMLLYGCETPGSNDAVWNCGEMAVKQPGLGSAGPCAKGSEIIYAWAKDAPPFILPQGVGFKVGRNSHIQYFILQVHYASIEKFRGGSTDDSGVFLYYTHTPQPKKAGVILLGTSGRIRPQTEEHMETACHVNEDKVIYPFAFRIHTHSLGRVVSGYKVSRIFGRDRWTLLGKRDPQLPQMFYPVFNNVTIRKGDILAARCTMVSNRDSVTQVGFTSKDEMCNFYLMYAVTDTGLLNTKSCFSPGPPHYYWSRTDLNNVPVDASDLTSTKPISFMPWNLEKKLIVDSNSLVQISNTHNDL